MLTRVAAKSVRLKKPTLPKTPGFPPNQLHGLSKTTPVLTLKKYTTPTRHLSTSSSRSSQSSSQYLQLIPRTRSSPLAANHGHQPHTTSTRSTLPPTHSSRSKQQPRYQNRSFSSSVQNELNQQQQQQFTTPPPEPSVPQVALQLLKRVFRNPFKRTKVEPQLPKSQEELALFLANHKRKKWIRRGLLAAFFSPFVGFFIFGFRCNQLINEIEGTFGGFESYAKANGIWDLYALPLQLDKPLVGALTAYRGEPMIEESYADVQKILIRHSLIQKELNQLCQSAVVGMKHYLGDYNTKTVNSAEGEQMKIRLEMNQVTRDLDSLSKQLRVQYLSGIYLFGQPDSIVDGVEVKRLSWFMRKIYPAYLTRSYELIQNTKLLLKQSSVLGLYLNSMQSATWRSTVPPEYQSLFGYQQFLYFAGRAVAKRQNAALLQQHLDREMKLEQEYEQRKQRVGVEGSGVEEPLGIYAPQDPPVMIQPDFMNGPSGGLNWRPLFSSLLKSDEDHDRLLAQREEDEKNEGSEETPSQLYLSSVPFYAAMLSQDEQTNLRLLPPDLVIDPTQLPFDKFNFNYLPPTEDDFINPLHYRQYSDYPEFLWRYTPMVKLPCVRLAEFIDRVTNPNTTNSPSSRRAEIDRLQNQHFVSPTLSFQALARLPRPEPIKYNPHNDAATLNEPYLLVHNPLIREGLGANDSATRKSFEWTFSHGGAGAGDDRPQFGTFFQIPFIGQMIEGHLYKQRSIEERAHVRGKLTGLDQQQDFILHYAEAKTRL